MKNNRKLCAALLALLLLPACAKIGTREFYDADKDKIPAWNFDGTLEKPEHLNPSFIFYYSQFCFYATDLIRTAKKNCGGSYCDSPEMIAAIKRARVILDRAYGPPGMEGPRELQDELYKAELAVFGHAKPKKEMDDYAK